jgi:hypothetical protein
MEVFWQVFLILNALEAVETGVAGSRKEFLWMPWRQWKQGVAGSRKEFLWMSWRQWKQGLAGSRKEFL